MRLHSACLSRLLLFFYLAAAHLCAENLPVLHAQGSFHGFGVVKTLDGKRIANGDFIQSVQGARVTSRLIFHFRDGSLDDETTVFTQHKVFRLISDHHIQRGPSFPKATDVLINAVTGDITSHGEKGRITHDHLDLPPDVCNGLPPVLAMNILSSTSEMQCSYVAPTEKPRLIHLSMKPAGTAPFNVGGTRRKAIDYVLHVEIGGLIGVIAPLVGQQPADVHLWILGGSSPAFIREEGQLYQGGPIWRIEQVSPTFDR
jgi:hypothetical protein